MSYRIILSETEEADLKKVVRENQKRKNILKRAYCILLKNEGQKNENITRLLGIHEDTIADWSKIYMKKGLEGLLQFKYSDRRSSKLKPYKHKIKRFASAKKMKTIEQLQKKVQEKFGVEVEYSWFYRYCVKNGIYKALKNNGHDKT